MIDVHAHFVPPGFVEAAEQAPGSLGATMTRQGAGVQFEIGARRFLCPTPGQFRVEDRLRDMDAAGVSVHVLAPAPWLFYYWADASLATRVARMTNDAVAETVAMAPDRLLGLATVPLSAPDALAEVDRAVGELGLHGITVGSAFRDEHIDGPTFRPILHRARELNVPVFVHPHNLAPVAGLEDHYLINLIGNPLATTIALVRLILSGGLEELAGLRTYWAHLGGYAAAAAGRLDHGYRVRDEPKASISREPSTYLREVWVDAIAHDPHGVRLAAEIFGRDKVVFGSDYDYDMGVARPRELLDAIAETDEDLARGIQARNALALFENVPALAERTLHV